MANAMAISIDNLQLKYWKAYAVLNVLAGSFSSSLCILPIHRQQKTHILNCPNCIKHLGGLVVECLSRWVQPVRSTALKVMSLSHLYKNTMIVPCMSDCSELYHCIIYPVGSMVECPPSFSICIRTPWWFSTWVPVMIISNCMRTSNRTWSPSAFEYLW